MIKSPKFILPILFSINFMFGIVGDWVSYGSQLTLKDLKIDGSIIKASSHGGIVEFNTETESFSTFDEGLEHIDIQKYFVNTDGSEWFSYASGIDGISYRQEGGTGDYFDFDFAEAKTFTGNNENVFVAYMNGLTPEIARFVKNNNRYVFQDTYNQFPEQPTIINDLALIGDSIYVATDNGLIKAWLLNANLKPESAWQIISLDSSEAVDKLHAVGDTLLFADGDNNIFSYYNGSVKKIKESDENVITFFSFGTKQYIITTHTVWDLTSDMSMRAVYSTLSNLCGFSVSPEYYWIAEEDRGLKRVTMADGAAKTFIPNTMLYTTAHSLALSNDNEVIVCGLQGISILEDSGWHNLVFYPGKESINIQSSNEYYSDTLDIAYYVGGETSVYDALVSDNNELYCSIAHVNIMSASGQSELTKGPGALQKINLNTLSEYTVFDTSDNILDGTQGVGGSSSYLILHGLAEDAYGNIWLINAQTLAAETLIKLRPNGTTQKFSVEESDDKLQILAREMIFDKYGYLWIANEARQADEPRTTGGITVFDPGSGKWALITTADGLTSNNVYSIDEDPLTGNMWVATESGVQMIRTQPSFDSGDDFTMNPPINGLSGMIPVKLRIDARGNKWILTESRGIQIYMTNNRWFDDGSGLTTDNSGLLDNVVYDLVFDNDKGYAYLLTASGLSRYEIAWTNERTDMNDVIVFPQPFKPGIDPYVAIDGIADQSLVRISTLDGRVLIRFEADAQENKGKQLVWDGKLANGDYIPRGVYLAFITNIDGLKKTVKFAVQ
jgi:ligand-binding sensor domain-containing protein